MTENTAYNETYHDETDDDGIVSLEDTTIQRDTETGELLPRKNYVDELGGETVSKPLTRDERKEYVEDLLDEDEDKEELSDAELAELFDRKVVKPDLTQHHLCGDHVTEKFVKEGLTKTQEDGFFIGILLASDENDLVRLIRGEYTDQELKMALASSGNWNPAGGRTDNEVRRDRRRQ